MASEIRVNTINSRTGLGTITVSETGQDLAGISTIANLYVPEYITHKGDTNTKFGFNNADTISAHTNGSERLRIDSSGNVGINEDSSLMDNGLLTLKFGTDKHMGISASQSELGSMPGLVAFKDNGSVQDIGIRGNIIRLATGSAERFRIDSSGRLLGGLTSSVRSTAYLQLKGSNTSDIALYWPQDAATAGSSISWLTDGGAAATETARIFCGQTTTGADGGYMTFMTHNGTSVGEKMRIAADGKVGIGLNNPGSMLHVQNSGQTDIVLGSTNAGGVYLILDGDSNGDGSGGDYSYVAHDTGGDLLIGADNPSGNAEIIFKAGNNSEVLRINSSGQVKIGSGSATGIHSLAKVLEIAGGDGGDLIIGNDASSNIGAGAHIGAIAFKNIDSSTGSTPHYAGIRCESEDTSGNMDLRFYTGIANLEADTPQAVLDVAGRLIIGASSAPTTNSNRLLQVVGDTNGGGVIALSRDDTTLQDETIGGIEFYGNDPSSYVRTAAMYCTVAASWGSNDYPSDLLFYTTKDNAASMSEKARITAAGSLNIGTTESTTYPLYVKTTTSVGVAKFESTVGTNEGTEFQIVKNSSSPADNDQISYMQFVGENDNNEAVIFGAIIQLAHDVSDGVEDGDMYFYNRNLGGFDQVLRIKHDGTFYGSSSNDISDQRLKENIATVTNATDKIKALKGRTFTWKAESKLRGGTQYGFIAQEVEGVVSDLVDGTSGIRQFDKDDNLIPQDDKALENTDEGTTYAKSVNAIGVVPILVEALKEALTEIDNLKARVTTLESA